jgi:hypothetical protein
MASEIDTKLGVIGNSFSHNAAPQMNILLINENFISITTGYFEKVFLMVRGEALPAP